MVLAPLFAGERNGKGRAVDLKLFLWCQSKGHRMKRPSLKRPGVQQGQREGGPRRTGQVSSLSRDQQDQQEDGNPDQTLEPWEVAA